MLRWLTLAVRLYGNMFAGHMILGIFALMTTIFLQCSIEAMNFVIGLPAIAWVLLLIVMYAMECLVAFLQAYVFSILTGRLRRSCGFRIALIWFSVGYRARLVHRKLGLHGEGRAGQSA